MIRFIYAFVGLVFAVSCALPEEESPQSQIDGSELVTVSFRTDLPGMVKSSLTIDEEQIKNINVYAFKDGLLVSEVYSLNADEITMILPANSTYNIYAVANIGINEADVYEELFVNEFYYSISSIRALSRGVPMRCVSDRVYVGATAQTVDLRLERMIAKINLSVDKVSLLDGLRVKSVRLCQSASRVHPFKWYGQGGSRVESESQTIDGDYASAADLNRLNAGREVTFYTLENCQGVLLPDNKRPDMKVPKMIPEKEKLCSYLEIECEFDGSGLFDGDVRYRIYLGLDECTSFDVPGNSSINIQLMLTGDGLKKVTWKANADVNVTDGYLSGAIEGSMHTMSDLYVGEILLYEVVLSEELAEYLGNDVSGCALRLMKDGKAVPGLAAEFLDREGLYAELRCLGVASGDLYLYDPYGNCMGCLEENVNINLPDITLAEYPQWLDDEPVEPLSFVPECEVNGSSTKVYVYLTDSKGYNLNGPRSYGFDNDLFDFYYSGTRSEGEEVESIVADVDLMPDVLGNPVACAEISCVNQGSDNEINQLLSSVYTTERSAVMAIHERNYEIFSETRVGLGVPPITLTLVDNGWAGCHSCQLSMKLDNPSQLPVDVSVWQLIATNSAYGSTDSEYVENNLTIDHIEYMTGALYNGNPPVYGSSSAFVSSSETTVYPLEGIDTEDLMNAINYNKRGAGQMIHMVDVTLAGHGLLPSDLILEDKVSNGSARYDYLYYSEDSWNYRGAGLSTAGRILSNPTKWTYDYPNLTSDRLDRLVERWDADKPVSVSMIYVSYEGRVAAYTDAAGAQYGLTLKFGYSGVVNGYVKTYPDGTWRDPKEHKCSAGISHTKGGVPLNELGIFEWADDGGLKSGMDNVYGYSYKDSDKPLGADSYMHRAHPTDMSLKLNLCVEGEKGNELYPYYVQWAADYLEYYHAQEAKTYNCKLNSAANPYMLSIVRHK